MCNEVITLEAASRIEPGRIVSRGLFPPRAEPTSLATQSTRTPIGKQSIVLVPARDDGNVWMRREVPVDVVLGESIPLMGCGRAAWLVLTGEAIDARRALEWGLVEEIGGEDAVQRLVQRLLAAGKEALRMQKQLLQLWDEASLATSVAASIERFAQIQYVVAQEPKSTR